jgi:hypothetical protein
MTMEEQQQVEVACVLQAPHTVEEIPDVLRRHERPTVHGGSACATVAKALSVSEKKTACSMVRALRFSGCRQGGRDGAACQESATNYFPVQK